MGEEGEEGEVGETGEEGEEGGAGAGPKAVAAVADTVAERSTADSGRTAEGSSSTSPRGGGAAAAAAAAAAERRCNEHASQLQLCDNVVWAPAFLERCHLHDTIRLGGCGGLDAVLA